MHERMNVYNVFPYHNNQTLCASRNQIYMIYGCSNDADMHEYMHYVSKSQQSRGPKAKIYECMYVMYACMHVCMHVMMHVCMNVCKVF